MDRGAWRATVNRVAKSWTRLKQLSAHIHTLVADLRCCTAATVWLLYWQKPIQHCKERVLQLKKKKEYKYI